MTSVNLWQEGGGAAVLDHPSSNEINNEATFAYDKANEFRREFHYLPNVLVQDPQRECAYYIKAEYLSAYETDKETWPRLNDGTVTFVIPNGEIVDEVPPYLRNPEAETSVLLKYFHGKTSYFMSLSDLEKFCIEQPKTYFDDKSISFILPRGTELVEEIPGLRRALLQSNTA